MRFFSQLVEKYFALDRNGAVQAQRIAAALVGYFVGGLVALQSPEFV
jgi:hypothetical protein